jgi:hypothetical protein
MHRILHRICIVLRFFAASMLDVRSLSGILESREPARSYVSLVKTIFVGWFSFHKISQEMAGQIAFRLPLKSQAKP